jgi:hypothetical protein
MGKVTQLQLRHDLNASLPTLAEGELFVSTDTFKLSLGSVANGNMPIATACKKYKAKITANDTTAVITTIYENTLGATPTITGTGASFAITSTNNFTLNKTFAPSLSGYHTANSNAVPYGVEIISNDSVNYSTDYSVDGDDIIIDILIEVFF